MNIDLKCTHIWNTCESIAALYYNKAVALIPQIKQFEKDFEPTRDEYCLQSRYLHRGFYCPSLILEHIVDNVKRGRLAKRMTSRTNPTNGYFYDEDDIETPRKTAWLLACCDEIVERAGCSSATAYRENGLQINFDHSQISLGLINMLSPVVGVIKR